MNKDQLQVLTEGQARLQVVVDRIDADLTHDRQDIQNFRVEMAGVKQGLEELRKIVTGIPQKTQDKVSEVTQPMIVEAQDLKRTIDKKKTIIVPEKKKSWWNIFRRR